ncbi:MAG TPA: GAF domain-containing SpoIIE family protein phosphatase [Gemmatimonadaceae bacterium]|nr:GAF domain-containing SpoIIE family protein phosphatase [Gemmatimonadaceae bacterium]
MKELGAILERFSEALRCPAVVWRETESGGPLVSEYGGPAKPLPEGVLTWAATPLPAEVLTDDGIHIIATLPGPIRAVLALGPTPAASDQLHAYAAFLAPVIAHFYQSALEVEHAAWELAERYEEINLLYTTSEILGRTVSLEEASRRILKEICETVGAKRAAILVHDRVTDTLQVVTALGFAAEDAIPIATTDPHAVSARVFREQRALLVDEGEMQCEAERSYRRGTLLSVPILWTNPGSPTGMPLGVVNLSERRTGQPFTAGDEKLVFSIATQIGTAIQNTRLVRASVAQQRLQQEMQLAHDLQMKLLPNVETVAPEATVAARVAPADSVGGDFYHLFRLGGGRTGILIGDVSSHGYRAALIMALAMSAAAIHAQVTEAPAELLNRMRTSLQEELSTTEMFISMFYAVIDPRARRVRYANSGHPHAFIVRRGGEAERLAALNPPLGMEAARPEEAEETWRADEDLLVLFTDGLSDARDRFDRKLGEQRLLSVVREARDERPSVVVDRVFQMVQAHTIGTPRRDDLTLVVART